MTVLIIEDLPEEQRKAKDAAVAAGFHPVLAETLEDGKRLGKKLQDKIEGIVTDMIFPESDDYDKKNPNGLSMVSYAVDNGIPVSVCTDLDHHFCHYVTDVLRTLSKLTGYRILITLDRKDWTQAMSDLRYAISKTMVYPVV